MEATIQVKLQPFQVPDYALTVQIAKSRMEGWSEAPKYELSELSVETLTHMCEEFKKGVFKKANKEYLTRS